MTHNYHDGRRNRGLTFKIRYLILAAIVALVAAATVSMVLRSNRVDRRLMALRAAGYPTSLAELALSNKLPMGMDNAAPVYQSAFGAFVPPTDPNIPYVGRRGESPDRGTPLPEPMAQAVAECLAANERCLALLHEAAGVAHCRYDYDYKQGFPHFQHVRSCAQLLTLAAISHASQGDADAAIARIEDGLSLSDSLAKEPSLIAYLVRIACTSLIIRGMERALSVTPFTDPQLRDLEDTLAATAERIDLAQVMVTERCFKIECIRDPSLMGMTGPGAKILRLPGIRGRALEDILDHMEASIEAARLPPTQRMTRFHEIEARLRGLSPLHIVIKSIAPAVSRIAELDLRAHAHLDSARTALAIERYRLASGKVPEQLADLVPKYMEQVPIDPFDGQPIRYRRTEPGYVLYSIMEDGQDNGGKEKEDVGKGEPYDLCFIVTR